MNKIKEPLLNIVLVEPRIPQNTGNIARTSAAFSLRLHLIDPLGFSISDKHLKRAGLDYWDYIDILRHHDFQSFLDFQQSKSRNIGFTKSARESLDGFHFQSGDFLLFGREDKGLSNEFKSKCDYLLSIPMPGGVSQLEGVGVRSLNLSSSVAIVSYVAMTQVRASTSI